ncbi:Putative ribonuclease H protein At1g65750 [Linum perenne]
MRWRIGDGASIKVWQDPWISSDTSRKVTSEPHDDLIDLRVNDLWIPGTRQWDVELIEELFNAEDANAISGTTLGEGCDSDTPIWHFSRHGNLTVSSAYRVWIDSFSDLGQYNAEGPWDKLWKVHAPPKTKIMAWRLMRNIVPTREALTRRHINTPGGCGMCDHDTESVWHLFLDCNYAKACWEKAGLQQLVAHLDSTRDDLQSWLTALLNHGASQHTEKALVLLWSLWRERNARVWRNERTPAFVVARLANESLEEWQKARAPDVTPRHPEPPPCPKWHPPPIGQLKCNVDCARFEDQKMRGVGMILRDHEGHIVEFQTRTEPGCPSATNCEALAMHATLLWLRSKDLQNVTIETDSQLVSNAIYSTEPDVTEFGETIRSCRSLLLPSFRIIFVRRDRNAVAHTLARQSRFLASPTLGHASPVWLEVVLGALCSNTQHT